MKWEIVIGLETHAQLSTASKMFSGASTAFGAQPNTQACAVDIALPGVLPVVNREAVAKAVRFGLAVNGNAAANINRRSLFARKNYFYPDLPKGYQISQYEMPIVKGGEVAIVSPTRGEMRVRLTRAHLEEDAGKSLHEGFRDLTGIDLNRAGTPLLEIVSEPDMRSAEEAVEYAKALHALVRWIGICDGNMQEGSFRCDANVSVRPAGSDKLGTRREIKNLNSFRFLQQAIEYETQWQIETLEGGGKIEQATVLFDPDRGETRAMRSKEDAHDYRYFPDPDLLPLQITDEWIGKIKEEMPELAGARLERFVSKYVLTREQARSLTSSRAMADYSEATLMHLFDGRPPPERFRIPADERPLVSDFVQNEVAVTRARLAANRLLGEVTAALNRAGLEIEHCPVSPQALAGLLTKEIDKTLSNKMAKEVFDAMWVGEGDADAIIAKRGLRQISDSGELEKIVDQVIAANAQQVADYKSGKDKAFNSLVGQAMKLSKGKANPQQVSDILKRKLSG